MPLTLGDAGPGERRRFTDADHGVLWQAQPRSARPTLSLPGPVTMFGRPGQGPTKRWRRWYDHEIDEPIWIARPLPARPLALLTSGGVRAGDTIVLTGVPINLPFYYEIPSAHWMTSGYLANAAVNANAAFAGAVFGTDFLSIVDFLDDADILGVTETANITGWVEIATASNNPALPIPQWSAWQQFTPGVFPATAWKLRIGMESASPAAQPQCSAFSFTGQFPTRTDNYVNQAVGTGGLTIVFKPDGSLTTQPFNSGVNGNTLPRVQVDWQATANDTYQITGLSLSQLTITFFNGGSPVSRTATIVVQGA